MKRSFTQLIKHLNKGRYSIEPVYFLLQYCTMNINETRSNKDQMLNWCMSEIIMGHFSNVKRLSWKAYVTITDVRVLCRDTCGCDVKDFSVSSTCVVFANGHFNSLFKHIHGISK